ncbi:MAG: AI-2E family transporter [Ruminococcaceae bacterium]|nr:AI-2E family transporter [Oscillospiraceae bacterium]
MNISDRNNSISSKIKATWLNFLYLLPVIIIAATILIYRNRLARVINPLFIGVIMFFVLEPAVDILEKKCRVKRTAAIAVVFLITIVIIIGIVMFIIPSLKANLADALRQLPLIKENFVLIKNKIYSSLNFANGTGIVSSIEKNLGAYVADAAKPKNILSIAVGFIDAVTASVITFYLLRDKEKAGNTVLALFPYKWRGFLIEIYLDIEKIFRSFVSGQLLIALVIGILEGLGLWAIGVPYPLLFGIIGGISNLIPYFGPFIGAVPAVIAAFIVSPFKAFLTALLFTAVQQIDNNFISPKIIEGKLGVHPVATILAVFVGGEFFGLKGMLLAVPAYAIICCFFVKIASLSGSTVESEHKI